MVGLIGISANVPEEFVKAKNEWGVSWAYIIREGVKTIKLQETLMQEKLKPEQIDWRIKAREKINAILESAEK